MNFSAFTISSDSLLNVIKTKVSSFYDFLSLPLIRILTIIENGIIIFIGEMDETKGD